MARQCPQRRPRISRANASGAAAARATVPTRWPARRGRAGPRVGTLWSRGSARGRCSGAAAAARAAAPHGRQGAGTTGCSACRPRRRSGSCSACRRCSWRWSPRSATSRAGSAPAPSTAPRLRSRSTLSRAFSPQVVQRGDRTDRCTRCCTAAAPTSSASASCSRCGPARRRPPRSSTRSRSPTACATCAGPVRSRLLALWLFLGSVAARRGRAADAGARAGRC